MALQLEGPLPDHLLIPVGGGSLLVKSSQAFDELVQIGLIASRQIRLHAVQGAGADPVVTAIRAGHQEIRPLRPHTIAHAVAVGDPGDGHRALQEVARRGGWGAAPGDEEILEGVALLEETEGIRAQPAGALPVAGLRRLLQEGRIQPSERVVLMVTGAAEPPGLSALEAGLPLLPARLRDFDRWWSAQPAQGGPGEIPAPPGGDEKGS
jgi:threonine synthase